MSEQAEYEEYMADLEPCEECGIHPKDLPSNLCVGCNSYKEHLT